MSDKKNFSQLLNENKWALGVEADTLVQAQITGEEVYKDGKKFYVVNTGLKSEGLINESEFGEEKPKEGDIVLVYLEKSCNKEGRVEISLLKAKYKLRLEELREAFRNSAEVEGKIEAITKDSYIIDLGSGISGRVYFGSRTPNNLLGQNIKVKINSFPKNGQRIPLSQKGLNSPIDIKHKVGEIVENLTITGKSDYLVFLLLADKSEGIIHMGDLSRYNQRDTISNIKKGDKIEKAKVLDIKGDRLILGVKQAKEDLWEEEIKNYPIGSVYKGIINDNKNFSVFVKIDGSIEGVIRASELHWGNKPVNIEEFPKGKEVSVKVIGVDKEKKRLILSLKQSQENPYEIFKNKHKIGELFEKAKIVDKKIDYCYVSLGEVDGFLSKYNCSWNRNESIAKFDSLKKGDEISVRLSEIKAEEYLISVIGKDFEDKLNKLHIGSVVKGKIKKTTPEGAYVALGDLEGFIKRQDLSKNESNEFYGNLIDKEVTAKVIGINKARRVVILSAKEHQRTIDNEAMRMCNTPQSNKFGDNFGNQCEEALAS